MSNSGIKICFSSRPWNVFEEAYGEKSEVNLNVQDHTSQDIANFVKDQFEEDKRFLRLRSSDARYQDLVDEIIERANGVFLWVFLVVRSIRRGFTNADTISDFQRRLRLLPTDLKTYFEFMLESVEEVYRSQAARIYLMCLASPRPLSVTTLSFFDEENPTFGIEASAQAYKSSLVDQGGASAIRRIKARCPDLLEIVYKEKAEYLSKYQVEFIHRTAHDFIATEDIASHLSSLERNFDADKHLCQAYIAHMKMLPQHHHYYWPASQIFLRIVDNFFFHAKSLESKSQFTDDLMMSNMILLVCPRKSWEDPKASTAGDICVLLTLAIQQRLTIFLKRNMKILRRVFCIEALQSSKETSLLSSALTLEDCDRRSDYAKGGIQVEIVSLLLEAGANPNQEKDFISTWVRFLGIIWRTRKSSQSSVSKSHKVAQLIELLVRHGADIKEILRYDDLELDLLQIVAQACTPQDFAYLQEIISQVSTEHSRSSCKRLAEDSPQPHKRQRLA